MTDKIINRLNNQLFNISDVSTAIGNVLALLDKPEVTEGERRVLNRIVSLLIGVRERLLKE